MRLDGINTSPFYSYLSGIALIRMVPRLRGWWEGNTFYINQSWEEVSRYLLQDYAPSPILTPWNKSGGWLVTSKAKKNVQHVETYRNSNVSRFRFLREAVATVDEVIKPYLDSGQLNANKGWASDEQKDSFVSELRSQVPDFFLAWIDTVYAFLPKEPIPIPIVGKVGSEGTGEYSKSFGDALFEVFDSNGSSKQGAEAALRAMLLGETAPIRGKASPGLYDPSSSGLGRNFQSGSKLEPQPNPWGVILALEGVIAFASRITNRFDGSDPGSPTIPFSIWGSKVGYPSAAEQEDVRMELWLPVWNRPLGKVQLESLFRAGRSRLDDRPVRDGLQFARSVSQLSQRLQIQRLERYGILERASEQGNNWACWLNTIYPNRKNRYLLGQCELFVRQYTQKAKSRQLSERYFQTAIGALSISDFLVDLGEALIDVDRHPKYSNITFPRLTKQWAEQLLQEDYSPETRLATVLAAQPTEGMPQIRWSAADMISALIDFNREWAVRASQLTGLSKSNESFVFCYGSSAEMDDVIHFIRGDTNNAKIWSLARGLRVVNTSYLNWERQQNQLKSPLGFAAIALCWHHCRLWGGSLELPYEGQILTGLMAGHSRTAIQAALRRLRSAEIKPILREGYQIPKWDCHLWAAALAFKLSNFTLNYLQTTLTDKEIQRETV